MKADGTVEGRSCGKCSLCCKITDIAESNKTTSIWCDHYEAGIGCAAYEIRPQICRDFFCYWMRDASLDDRWNPATAHFLMRDDDDKTLLIQVDPQHPDAWRREPYYSMLRQRAPHLYPTGGKIFVRIAAHTFVMLPDRDEDLGVCSTRDRIRVGPRFTPAGVRWDVKVERAQ